ncbi:hypothetical protein Bbelb_252810 [Branchiostoma belcheri]|nr:hypothetical protein Bbelb_252810 [Branchiostoma belcheri]
MMISDESFSANCPLAELSQADNGRSDQAITQQTPYSYSPAKRRFMYPPSLLWAAGCALGLASRLQDRPSRVRTLRNLNRQVTRDLWGLVQMHDGGDDVTTLAVLDAALSGILYYVFQVLVEQRQRKAAEERRRQAEQEARLNRMPAWKRDILVRKRQSRSDPKTSSTDSIDHNVIQNEDTGPARGTGVFEQNGESSLGEGGPPDTCRTPDVWNEQGVSEEKIVSVHENIFVKWQARNRSPPYDRNDTLAHSGQHKSHSPRGVGIPNNVIIIEKYGGSGNDLQADVGKESVQGLAPTGLERPGTQTVFSFLRDAKPEREVIIIEKDDTEDKSVPCSLSGKVNRLRGKFGDEPRERKEVLSATRTKVPETVKSSTRQGRGSQRKGQKSTLSAAGSMDSLLDVVQQPNQAQKKKNEFHYSSCENLSELDTLFIQKSGSDDSVTVDTSPNIRPRSLSQSKMHETTEQTGKKTERVKVESSQPTSQQSTRESPKDQTTKYNDTSSKPSMRVKPVSVTRNAPVGGNHVRLSGQSHAAKVNRHDLKKKTSLGNEPGSTRKESDILVHSKNAPEEGIQIIPTTANSSAKLTAAQNDPVAAAIASIKAQSKNTFIVQPTRPAGKHVEMNNQHRKEKEPSHLKDRGAKEDDKSPGLPLPLQPNKKQDSRKNDIVGQSNDTSFVIRPLTQRLKENPSEYQSATVRKATEKQFSTKEQKSNITPSSTSSSAGPTTTPVLQQRDAPESNQHANRTFLPQESTDAQTENKKTHLGRKKAPAPQPPSVASVNGQGTARQQAGQLKPGAQDREELPTTNIDDVEISAKIQDNNNCIRPGKTGDQTQATTMQSSPAGSELGRTASPPSLDVSPIAPPRHKATVRKLTVADYVVIGGYEKLSKSSISKGESKKLKISFNDSPTTFEYPSEQSLLEEDDRESVQAPTGLRTTPSLTTSTGDKVLSGGLHSYQPSQVTSNIVAGQQRAVASTVPEDSQAASEGHPVEIFAVKPLADSEAPMWSSSSSMASALLF